MFEDVRLSSPRVEAHPAFQRSVSAIVRLGVSLHPLTAEAPPETGLPEAHLLYRTVTAALLSSDLNVTPLLADASLLERASYELGLFSPLLRAADVGGPSSGPVGAGYAEDAFVTAPSVRLVHTRWDWDAFLADPSQAEPTERAATWVLRLTASGPVQMRRLHPLPALLLEACMDPLTRDAAAAVVVEQVEGDPARIAAVVNAQLDELRASGLLLPFSATAADHAVEEMQRLLLADEAPHAPAKSIVGQLGRTLRATRKYAAAAMGTGDALYPRYRLDVYVNSLDQLLRRARLRNAFRTELDGYWAGVEVHSRVASLAPLLDVLDRALNRGVHALPPYVLSS